MKRNISSKAFSVTSISRCLLALLLLGLWQSAAVASSPLKKYVAEILPMENVKIAPSQQRVQSRAATQADNGIGEMLMCNQIPRETYEAAAGIYLDTNQYYGWLWVQPDNIAYEETQTVLSYSSAGNYFYFQRENGSLDLEAIKIHLAPNRTNNASLWACYADFANGKLYRIENVEFVTDYDNHVIYWKPGPYKAENIVFWLESGELNVVGFEIYSTGRTPADFFPASSVAQPVFRPGSCEFREPLTIEIQAEEGHEIYYSTDGNDPSVSEPYKYNGPIVISATTTVKAIAVNAAGETSRVATAVYTCVRHGIGEGYNPPSPGNPGGNEGEQEKRYHLTLVANPSSAGYVSAGSTELKAGEQTRVYTNANTGFVFKNWTIEGTVVSDSPSFNYVMPDYDVTIVANYVYDPAGPGNPSPEEQKVKHPVVLRSIPSSAASLSPSGVFDMEENTSRQVYAYPRTGWKLVGWTINGVEQPQTTSPLTINMEQKALDIAAYFTYDPSSPSNPGANYYNPATGQVIVDDFEPGKLYNALENLVGYNNYANVSSLIVKGQMTSNDFGYLANLSNAATIDLSRTGGMETVPSYAFQSMAASSILLPSTVTGLGRYVFSSCANLTALTLYAPTPPVCDAYTFSGFTNQANCTVYVPAFAIELYSTADYWKDFTILPITDDAHVLQVNLPADAADGRYKHNSLELVNVNSGVRQKYVISDRLLYTFNGLQKDEQYNIYMYSQAGLEIGRIENVVIPDQDIEVTFDRLKSLYTVFAKVLDAGGADVTDRVTVEWLKPLADETVSYLRKGVSLGEVPDGQQLICRITLDSKLGVVYANPEDVAFTVSADNNTCEVSLAPFRAIELTGSVVDGDGAPLSGASVSISQTLNNEYFKTFTTKTDRKGLWKLSVLDAPETRLTYAATECINVNDTIGAFEANVSTLDLGKTTLKTIVGARIVYGFTYQAAGAEEAAGSYSDYQNVLINVFNVTQNRAHAEVSHQYPVLVILDENVHVGDELRLTAVSKTGAFNPVVETVTVGENQRAEATFGIVGKGGISASFEMTENPAVIAMLYAPTGELLTKQVYAEAQTRFTELEDGDYTLVSMGQSDLMNAILRLSNFREIGLVEGKDYVQNVVKVESGKLTEVKNSEIPAFDESLFYYTNSNTSFSVNKSSITTGNYLTLRSTIDFKNVYKNGISNVALVVDLPEACDFVEQSVIQGPNLLPYTLDNNRLTVQLGNTYQSQVRFCVVPTQGGAFNATASVVFDYNGKTITQPIGAAVSEIKDLEIVVPSVTADIMFKVSGTAKAQSEVKIMEDGIVLGTGKANSAGLWNIECALDKPYNLSRHSIYAEITVPEGMKLISESKELTYDVNALQVSKVTMYHWNPELNGWKGNMETSVFDFLNPKTSATQWTIYYPKKEFTYTIEFTDNDPERISNVILCIHTADGRFVPCKASFDQQKRLWYAEINMGSSPNGYYPVNCSVDFDYVAERKVDNRLISDVKNRDGLFMADYTEMRKSLEELINRADVVSDEEWEQFYSQNGLVYEPADGEDVDFPVDFDQWTEEQQELYLNELYKKVKGEYDMINQVMLGYENMFSLDSGGGSITLGDGAEIITKDCAGITEQSLIEQGFTAFQCIDGSRIYTYISSEKNVFVDLNNNLYVETHGSVMQTLGLGDDFLSLLRTLRSLYASWNDTNIALCINLLKEIKGVFENANLKFTTLLQNAEVELFFDADKWVTKFTNQQRTLRGMITKAPNSAVAIAYRKLLSDVMAKKALAQGFKSCIKPAFKFLAKALPISDWIFITADLINKGMDIYEIYALIDSKTCLTEPERQYFITQNRWLTGRVGAYAGGSIIPTAIGDAEIFVGVLGTMETGGVSLGVSVLGFITKSVAQITTLVLDNMLTNDIAKLKFEVESIKCKGDEDNKPIGSQTGGGAHQSGSSNDNVRIDPSGFVYEAVPTNRVEGVQATIYYKETKEDMYGDPYEEIVLWNAEEYAQKNPLFTDENGMYRWDVPQGLWQVKFEKDGYQTAHSEWLPVPPPQLEVNIGIVQNKQPEVTEARAYEEGIEVQFDKFMDLSTLTTSNIYVIANGEKLDGEIRLVDATLADEYASEEDAEALRYASRVRFVPEVKLSATTGEIRVTVNRNVLSYAGIPMTETYTQVLDVEKEVQEIVADDVKVLYGGEKEVTIHALPFEAAVGRMLHIANSSDLIASIDKTEVALDEEGKAVIRVKGDLPGRTQLMFTIDDVTVSGECIVDVVTEIITAEAPKASRASGTAVYRGTKVALSTDSKDATIYFTTDGSCPCDENGTRRKYTVPIVIGEDTQIMAVTSIGNSGDDLSEIVEFNYTLKRSDMDFQMPEGWTWISHSFEKAIAPAELTVDEGVSRILSQTQEVIRDPQMGMTGTLAELSAAESYKVETTTATARQRLSDIAWNPATPIGINTGWNWLGYPVGQTMTVGEAFAPTAAESGDVIVGQNGFAMFDGEKWTGTLETMSPGMGYMYQSRSAKNVVYNTSIVSNASSKYVPGISNDLSLVLDIHKYGVIMPVIATVSNTDGFALDNEDYQVAAFCETECRGIGRVVNGLVMMNVYGNPHDRITFRVTDADGEINYSNKASIEFSEKVVGDFVCPYPIVLDNQSGMTGVGYEGNVKISIEDDMMRIIGINAEEIDFVEVYDVKGQKLIRETHVTEAGIRLSTLTDGTYVVIVNSNGEYTYHKMQYVKKNVHK